MKTAEQYAMEYSHPMSEGDTGWKALVKVIAEAMNSAARNTRDAAAKVVVDKADEHRQLAKHFHRNRKYDAARAHEQYAKVLDGSGESALYRIQTLAMPARPSDARAPGKESK